MRVSSARNCEGLSRVPYIRTLNAAIFPGNMSLGLYNAPSAETTGIRVTCLAIKLHFMSTELKGDSFPNDALVHARCALRAEHTVSSRLKSCASCVIFNLYSRVVERSEMIHHVAEAHGGSTKSVEVGAAPQRKSIATTDEMANKPLDSKCITKRWFSLSLRQ